MTYDLFIGDRMFSSWSLRGWLMLEKFGLPHRTHLLGLYNGNLPHDLEPLAPARLVPVLRDGNGLVIGETLAMAETLAERHPQAGFWPAGAGARSQARWLCAEMVSGFHALRSDCPMQLSHVWEGFEPSAEVRRDLARIETLWQHAWRLTGGDDRWLFGAYSLADVFFAPVATRIIGYDLPVSKAARAYCIRTIEDAAFWEWRTKAFEKSYNPFPYPLPLNKRAWPGDQGR